MANSPVDNEIIYEYFKATGRKIRAKDIMEWSTSEEHVKNNLIPGEEEFFAIPGSGLYVAIKIKK